MAVKIKKAWDTISNQRVTSTDDKAVWMVSDLIERSKDLPIIDIPMDFLALDFNIGGIRVREFIAHMKMVLEADMSFPVILDENGCMFDGRHRAARALLEEMEIIKGVRFEEDPHPTFTKDK